MSNPAYVQVMGQKEGEKIFLYTHNDRNQLANIVHKALKKIPTMWELVDFSYTNRVIFSEMISDDVDGIKGYGITNKAPSPIEANGLMIKVNLKDKIITFPESKKINIADFLSDEREMFYSDSKRTWVFDDET